ncbi:Subtilisin-like protease [Rhynchospora pubera]|uniref:Subtilisin-like protease n=1 Tax=Rhynchospora pubera TaxID=906938 RepID=A0AAV8BSE8_9POAL|nr:Subtilisin-like protease [Rhynchospora pubera]
MKSFNLLRGRALSRLRFFLFFSFMCSLLFNFSAFASTIERQRYIIHVAPANSTDIESYHRSFLPNSTAINTQEIPQLIYSYSEAFSGFAARLTKEELDYIKKKDGYRNVYPDQYIPLATTHTPDFLGLQTGSGLWAESNLGHGIIIGMIDTGILPSHRSFNDEGLPPPPKRWKGICEFKTGGCNNKIIGARAFGSASINSTAPPLDDAGHGTHTASTAAGNFVGDVSFRGDANGTASGMAPHAHLAIYKVCNGDRCSLVDVLAGFDAAVKDEVDVLSFSLGFSTGQLQYDLIAMATFKAMEKGIFVSCAAGNNGPTPSSVSNEYPWVLTVAAGTTDRTIRASVRLGNGLEFDGESLFQPANFTSVLYPLVYPAANLSTNLDCVSSTGFDVHGKIGLCMSSGLSGRVDIGSLISGAGGAGLILMNPKPEGYTTFADAHLLPASDVSYSAGTAILSYIDSTANATATFVFKGTVVGSSPSPTVAFFSSRGPSKVTPGILKPDITGPGVNILAAWAPTKMNPIQDDFNIISGTSMATPHLSGIAALIKSVHPDWSPAAIKSAMMTTSDTTDSHGEPIKDEQYHKASFFAMGVGHVNPSRAVDPGLVYDLGVNDYISYLCGLGIGDADVSKIVQRTVNCSLVGSITEAELNYPAILIDTQSSPITLNRTLTNVGMANSKYVAEVDVPMEVTVIVKPSILQFTEVNEKMSFTVTVSWNSTGNVSGGAEGNLKWVSDSHVVRSPLVVLART